MIYVYIYNYIIISYISNIQYQIILILYPTYDIEPISGWWFQPSWKIWVRQWEGWQPIYEMENKSHGPNH